VEKDSSILLSAIAKTSELSSKIDISLFNLFLREFILTTTFLDFLLRALASKFTFISRVRS